MDTVSNPSRLFKLLLSTPNLFALLPHIFALLPRLLLCSGGHRAEPSQLF